MWFILSLIALVFWTGSDIFSKVGSKPDDRYSEWKMVFAVGVVMGAHALFQIFFLGTEISFDSIVKYLPASALYIASMLLGYIALKYIELSISSPICNSSGAIASLVLILFFFSRSGIESTLQLVITLVAIVACGLGVFGLGIVETNEDLELRQKRQEKENIKYTKSLIAVLLPVLYCVLDSLGTVADSFILDTLDEDVANVSYELTFLASGLVAGFYAFVIKRDKIKAKREGPKFIGAVCETAGQLAYVYAISLNAVYSAPIISCYCVLSVVLSTVFLKERLSVKHYAAISLTVVGIVLLGIFGG